MTIADDVIDVLARHPAIGGVRLVGSRATGTENALSDWDFAVETDQFAEVARDVDLLVAPLEPIAQQWDPLSETWCWMAIVRGPSKLDFIFSEAHQPEPPWQPNEATLGAIDDHFWDWALWLGSKQAGRKTKLVDRELQKMFEHILGPMGVESRPSRLDEAMDSYVTARARFEQRFGVAVPRVLEREVRPALG